MGLLEDVEKYLDKDDSKEELAGWQRDKIRSIDRKISKDSDPEEVLRDIERELRRNKFSLGHPKDKSAMKDILKKHM
ncbi:hypothetical protein ACFL2R_00015 [Patescibacteria group bacterium]